MNDTHTLIQRLKAAKLTRRRHFLIAEYLANRLQVSHEGSQLVLVVGSGKEESNLKAITYWVSTRIDGATLLNQELEAELQELETALFGILVDRLPTP
ncbi:hypothetical protein [Microbulbifer elongatus]|uniref:hypothetical protein n=1 Tax=Microbulbifer elongatus TaxID=86173 RepID=UPI001CFCFDEC|nr:hypothetical protein [Microbulbifer elongatus]